MITRHDVTIQLRVVNQQHALLMPLINKLCCDSWGCYSHPRLNDYGMMELHRGEQLRLFRVLDF
jgi:hypothetical protein